MNEYPILFSGEMVKAILVGKKTQTRRVIELQPSGAMGIGECHYSPSGHAYSNEDGSCTCQPVKSPYGQPGDSLWVRETHWIDWYPSGVLDNDGKPGCVYYQASNLTNVIAESIKGHWRPSIHMHRWASRINLGIVHIRAERLQDISERDTAAEGVDIGQEYWYSEFHKAWDSINSKRGYPWASNPWVWVIEFEVL